MWPLKSKKSKENKNVLDKLRPGESVLYGGNIPKDAQRAVIKIYYNDEFGNKYQTSCSLDFKQRKVISQEYKIVEKVKDIGDEVPKLVIDEDSIDWPDIDSSDKKR